VPSPKIPVPFSRVAIIGTGLIGGSFALALRKHFPDVTLIGWGSTWGVIEEAIELLRDQGISGNQLQIRWLVPLHGDTIVEILKNARHTIIVENNFSGQFARYLRSETSFVPNGHIRKYDGEPFMPHHIVEAVKEQLAGNTTLSVPTHEIMV